MLVLSRKECEEVIIDGNIRLRIIRVQGNRVRIGIEAPEGVAVLRAEIAGPPECDQRTAGSHARRDGLLLSLCSVHSRT